MKPSEKSLREIYEDALIIIITSGYISPAEAASIRGKYGFCSVGLTGKSGRLSSRALINRQYYLGNDYSINNELKRDLLWMKVMLTRLPKASTYFSGNERPTVILFTDASSES